MKATITYILRKKNKCDHFLANEGHRNKEGLIVWKAPLKKMEFFLLIDSSHVANERFKVICYLFPCKRKKKQINVVCKSCDLELGVKQSK